MYTKQQIEAAKQTARNLTGAADITIETHNAMGIRLWQPQVIAHIKVEVKGYPTRTHMMDNVRLGTILELAAP